MSIVILQLKWDTSRVIALNLLCCIRVWLQNSHSVSDFNNKTVTVSNFDSRHGTFSPRLKNNNPFLHFTVTHTFVIEDKRCTLFVRFVQQSTWKGTLRRFDDLEGFEAFLAFLFFLFFFFSFFSSFSFLFFFLVFLLGLNLSTDRTPNFLPSFRLCATVHRGLANSNCLPASMSQELIPHCHVSFLMWKRDAHHVPSGSDSKGANTLWQLSVWKLEVRFDLFAAQHLDAGADVCCSLTSVFSLCEVEDVGYPDLAASTGTVCSVYVSVPVVRASTGTVCSVVTSMSLSLSLATGTVCSVVCLCPSR